MHAIGLTRYPDRLVVAMEAAIIPQVSDLLKKIETCMTITTLKRDIQTPNHELG